MIDAYVKFVKAHENILLVGGLLFVALTLGNKWLDHRVTVADEKAGAAAQVVGVQHAANQDLSAQLAAQQAEYQRLQAQTAARLAALAAQVAARDQQKNEQVKADQTAAPSALAARWSGLLALAPDDVAPAGNDTYVVKDQAARTTVENLENVKVLVDDDQDQRAANAAQAGQLADLQKTTDLYAKTTLGLQAELTDEKKACVAQVAQVKAQARRSKLRWFLAGFVAGAAIVGYVLK